MPHARYVPHWRSLLACWTRSVALGRSVPKGGLTDEVRLQYEWLVRQTIRWRRPDGNLMFEDPLASPAAVDDLLSAALRLGGDRAVTNSGTALEGGRKPSGAVTSCRGPANTRNGPNCW